MADNLPSYAELIAVLENSHSVRSISLTEKRIDVLVKALRIADAGVVDAIEGLLQYTGGWDLPLQSDHPISKARLALSKARLAIVNEHPPCQRVAPVEHFDLHTLTADQLAVLRILRVRQIVVDNLKVTGDQRTLQQLGLATIEWIDRTGKDFRVAITVTNKGRNAR